MGGTLRDLDFRLQASKSLSLSLFLMLFDISWKSSGEVFTPDNVLGSKNKESDGNLTKKKGRGGSAPPLRPSPLPYGVPEVFHSCPWFLPGVH